MSTYAEFLIGKTHSGSDGGFAPVFDPDFLFDFQHDLVEWSLRRGRAAIFADCGLGKTPMQLVWAENVVRKTNGRVLKLKASYYRQAVKNLAEAQREDFREGLGQMVMAAQP